MLEGRTLRAAGPGIVLVQLWNLLGKGPNAQYDVCRLATFPDQIWSRWPDSNRWPAVYETAALPL